MSRVRTKAPVCVASFEARTTKRSRTYEEIVRELTQLLSSATTGNSKTIALLLEDLLCFSLEAGVVQILAKQVTNVANSVVSGDVDVAGNTPMLDLRCVQLLVSLVSSHIHLLSREQRRILMGSLSSVNSCSTHTAGMLVMLLIDLCNSASDLQSSLDLSRSLSGAVNLYHSAYTRLSKKQKKKWELRVTAPKYGVLVYLTALKKLTTFLSTAKDGDKALQDLPMIELLLSLAADNDDFTIRRLALSILPFYSLRQRRPFTASVLTKLFAHPEIEVADSDYSRDSIDANASVMTQTSLNASTVSQAMNSDEETELAVLTYDLEVIELLASLCGFQPGCAVVTSAAADATQQKRASLDIFSVAGDSSSDINFTVLSDEVARFEPHLKAFLRDSRDAVFSRACEKYFHAPLSYWVPAATFSLHDLDSSAASSAGKAEDSVFSFVASRIKQMLRSRRRVVQFRGCRLLSSVCQKLLVEAGGVELPQSVFDEFSALYMNLRNLFSTPESHLRTEVLRALIWCSSSLDVQAPETLASLLKPIVFNELEVDQLHMLMETMLSRCRVEVPRSKYTSTGFADQRSLVRWALRFVYECGCRAPGKLDLGRLRELLVEFIELDPESTLEIVLRLAQSEPRSDKKRDHKHEFALLDELCWFMGEFATELTSTPTAMPNASMSTIAAETTNTTAESSVLLSLDSPPRTPALSINDFTSPAGVAAASSSSKFNVFRLQNASMKALLLQLYSNARFGPSEEVRRTSLQSLTKIGIRREDPVRMVVYEMLTAIDVETRSEWHESNLRLASLQVGDDDEQSLATADAVMAPRSLHASVSGWDLPSVLVVFDAIYALMAEYLELQKRVATVEQRRAFYRKHEELKMTLSCFCVLPSDYYPFGEASKALLDGGDQ